MDRTMLPVRFQEDFYYNDGASVQKGSIGHITQDHPDHPMVTVMSTDGIKNESVPLPFLQIGTRRVDLPQLIATPLQTINEQFVAAGSSVVARALSGGLSAIIANSNTPDLKFLPPWVATEFGTSEEPKTERMDNLVGTIVKGIREAGMFDAFCKADCQMSDFIQASRDAGTLMKGSKKQYQPNNRSGIYLRCYRFQNAARNAIYVGRTNEYATRHADHERRCAELRSSWIKTPHYMYVNSQKPIEEMCTVPICYLPEGDDAKHLWTLTEQLFILLFSSYHYSLKFSPEPSGTSDELSAVARSVADSGHAQAFINNARIGFDRVGWIPYTRRNGFGATTGLNWTTPITEDDEIKLWTLTRNRDGIQFRMSRQVMPEGGKKSAILWLRNQNPYLNVPEFGKYGLGVTTGTLPPPHTPYYIVVELANSSPHEREHPYPYYHVPPVGPFEDWWQVRKLAIKLEWQKEDGTWLNNYLGQTPHAQLVIENNPGTIGHYLNAVALIRALLRLRCDPAEWAMYFEPFLVKEVAYDPLARTFKVWNAPETVKSQVKKLTMTEMAQLLTSRGHKGIGPLGVAQGKTRPTNNKRCDRCIIKTGGRPCADQQEVDGYHTCKGCLAFNSPCTFTTGGPKGQQYKDLREPQLVREGRIQHITDPQVTSVVPPAQGAAASGPQVLPALQALQLNPPPPPAPRAQQQEDEEEEEEEEDSGGEGSSARPQAGKQRRQAKPRRKRG